MYCSNCGKELKENAAFCSHCGKPVSGIPANNKSTDNNSSKGGKGDGKFPLVPVIILVVVIAVIIFAFIWKQFFSKSTNDQDNGNSSSATASASDETGNDEGDDNDENADALHKYSQEITCNYGMNYAQYLSHNGNSDGTGYEYSAEDALKDQYLGKLIYDFDDDGDEELLAIYLDDEFELTLEMYEQDGDKVYLSYSENITDSYGSEYEAFTIIQGATGDSISNPGILDCYIYEHDGVNIALQASNSEGLTGDGVNMDFLVLKYADNAFTEEFYYNNGGDDFSEDEEYVYDIEEFADIGITIQNFESLMFRGMVTQDGLDHAREVCRCRLYYNDIDSSSSDFREGEFDQLRTGCFTFAAEDDLRNDLEETSSENKSYQHAVSDSAQDAYRKFLINGDYFNQVGEYITLGYAIRDVDGDDIPELMLLKDYYTYWESDGQESDGNIFFYRVNDGNKVQYVGDVRSLGENTQYDYDDPKLYYSAENTNLAVYAQYSDFATYSFFTMGQSGLANSYHIGYYDDKSSSDYVTNFKKWTDDGKEEVFASCHWGDADEEQAYETFYEKLGDLKKMSFTDIAYVAGINDQTKSGLVDYKESYGPISGE